MNHVATEVRRRIPAVSRGPPRHLGGYGTQIRMQGHLESNKNPNLRLIGPTTSAPSSETFFGLQGALGLSAIILW